MAQSAQRAEGRATAAREEVTKRPDRQSSASRVLVQMPAGVQVSCNSFDLLLARGTPRRVEIFEGPQVSVCQLRNDEPATSAAEGTNGARLRAEPSHARSAESMRPMGLPDDYEITRFDDHARP